MKITESTAKHIEQLGAFGTRKICIHMKIDNYTLRVKEYVSLDSTQFHTIREMFQFWFKLGSVAFESARCDCIIWTSNEFVRDLHQFRMSRMIRSTNWNESCFGSRSTDKLFSYLRTDVRLPCRKYDCETGNEWNCQGVEILIYVYWIEIDPEGLPGRYMLHNKCGSATASAECAQ